jgi:hypothetical protein
VIAPIRRKRQAGSANAHHAAPWFTTSPLFSYYSGARENGRRIIIREAPSIGSARKKQKRRESSVDVCRFGGGGRVTSPPFRGQTRKRTDATKRPCGRGAQWLLDTCKAIWFDGPRGPSGATTRVGMSAGRAIKRGCPVWIVDGYFFLRGRARTLALILAIPLCIGFRSVFPPWTRAQNSATAACRSVHSNGWCLTRKESPFPGRRRGWCFRRENKNLARVRARPPDLIPADCGCAMMAHDIQLTWWTTETLVRNHATRSNQGPSGTAQRGISTHGLWQRRRLDCRTDLPSQWHALLPVVIGFLSCSFLAGQALFAPAGFITQTNDLYLR